MFKSQLKTLSVIVFSSLIISQSYSADDSKKLDVSESAFKCLSALAASGRFFVDNIWEIWMQPWQSPIPRVEVITRLDLY